MNPGENPDPDIGLPMGCDYDVLNAGAGPVGLTIAIRLGARGWRVSVVERWP